MNDTSLYWIEHGLAACALRLADELDDAAFLALLPPVTGLLRLWGARDAQRAAGLAATIAHPLLRAAARAAAVEFAPWPPATVCGILRRALVDAVAEPWASRQPRPVLTDLWDDLAVAWARHAPHNLDWVSAQLYGQVAGGLWQAAILQRVQHQSVTPPAAQRPAGGLAQWRWQARWALTEAGRARACLALAAATPGDGERE